MIKLTGTSGIAIFVNPDQIIGVNGYHKGGAFIQCHADAYVVTETPEEVVRKIMNYKLAMVNYTSGSQVAHSYNAEKGKNPFVPATDSWLELQKLAGLEQTP
ncbi:MAG: Flagellar and Swarming motility protein [Paenibacillus sp.]|jgi:uncharacterized protein YlzI (FlbEa/FlbD family)|nr:Flagellar and Swarming motility protein [Paenibacillus sp.]